MKNKTILPALLVMMLWGILFPAVKLGYAHLGLVTTGDIIVFAGARFFVCGGVILLYCLFTNKQAFRSVKGQILPLLLSGFFAVILHYSFSYVGISLTDGSKSAILKQSGSIFYMCFATFFFPEDRMTPRKLAGLLLGISGILAINTTASGITFHPGDILLLISSLCMMASNIVIKKAMRYTEPIVSTGISQFFGGSVLLAVGSAIGGEPAKLIPQSSTAALILAVILTASVFSYCLWYSVIKKESLSKLFIIKFAEPLFATLFSWLLLGENIFRLNYLLAFLLISAGIVVANTRKKPPSC